MTFEKLKDRVLLFIEERPQMIIELLKEAELEMTRKCNMYEDTREYTADGSQSVGLPSNFKQVILFTHKGTKLQLVGENDIGYESDGDVPTGDPSGYFIRNNGIFLNTKPSSGKFNLSYYCTVEGVQDTTSDPSPVIPEMYHRDLCNYAIAIASAKDNPQMHDKHWTLWMQNIREIINEDANRELIHTIRNEV
jgi:hypothetical protein